MRGKIPVLFVLLCFSAAYLIASPAILGVKEADANKVSVLYTGDPFPGVTPCNSMQEDAFITVTPIQACSMHYAGITTEDIYKSMRVYMPRSYRDYVDRYDVMILSDSNKGVLTTEQISWLRDGVIDGGIGLLMVGGLESFGGHVNFPSWQDSAVEDVLPVIVPPAGPFWMEECSKIMVEAYSNEFIASLPYRPTPGI